MSVPLTSVEERIIKDLQAGAGLKLTLVSAGFAQITKIDGEQYQIGESEVSNLESVGLIEQVYEDENEGFRRFTYALTEAGKDWPAEVTSVITPPATTKINWPILLGCFAGLGILIFLFLRFFA